MNEEHFTEWMAATYPGPQQSFTREDMLSAWDAGHDDGFDYATEYYGRGGTFR